MKKIILKTTSLILTVAMLFAVMATVITAFAAPTVPVTGKNVYTALVLDVSGSMEGTPIEKQKEAAISFCKTITEASSTNYVTVITFGDYARNICSFTNDLSTLTDAINSTYTVDMTNTYDGLSAADDALSAITSVNVRKVIVLCSDGLPNEGKYSDYGHYDSTDYYNYEYANAVYDKASVLKQSYEIYTLGFFHNIDDEDTREFAESFMNDLQTDGYYNVNDPDELVEAYEDIAGEIVEPNTSYESVAERIIAILQQAFNLALSVLLAAFQSYLAG